MMSFVAHEASIRLEKSNPTLAKILRVIDWKKISKRLDSLETLPRGQKPYDHLAMFKAVLLAQWYSLSDPELEQSLSVRMDFIAFTELEDAPDETTLCRFRNKIISLGLEKLLFQEVNRQLQQLGLQVKKCSGAVVDTTLIESACRPRRVLETVPSSDSSDRAEDSAPLQQPSPTNIEYSKDPDARWLKKGSRYHFGYKGFVTTDSKDGFIRHVHVTSANISEVHQLPQTLKNIKTQRVFADKAYACEKNDRFLKRRRIENGIMSKASRNHPLSSLEKLRNKLISHYRFIVEQGFGTLKRRFRFSRASYQGLAKVQAQMILKATCFNLLKAMNKLAC